MRFRYCSALFMLFLLLLGPQTASATYSIIACDPETGACGVAVATNNLAVGSSVCYAAAGVGALVTQYETNPNYGPEGLRLMREKWDVQDVLAHLLKNDNNFEGQDIAWRQVALVNVMGQTAVHSGEHVLASAWAGSREGKHYAIQGNGLVGEAVLIAMEQRFLETQGTLAERLMAALVAGQEAGGQSNGRMSAALLVRTEDGWPFDIDLRVDAGPAPVDELQTLLNLHYARQAIIRAERYARAGEVDKAWNAVAEALYHGASWDRVWRRAARLAVQMDEPERAMDYLAVFKALNPIWAREEITQDRYAILRGNPLFQAWLSESY